jgi:hypothetical protein
MPAPPPSAPVPPRATPPSKPLWKKWWVWLGAFLIFSYVVSLVAPGKNTSRDGASVAAPSQAGSDGQAPTQVPEDVPSLPIFDGRDGGEVIALVNGSGVVSAKVLGDQPTACSVTASDIVEFDHVSSQYEDTGMVAVDLAGEPATSLMATFSGPIGTDDSAGYVFHADMDLQQPYPKAIVVSLDCSY